MEQTSSLVRIALWIGLGLGASLLALVTSDLIWLGPAFFFAGGLASAIVSEQRISKTIRELGEEIKATRQRSDTLIERYQVLTENLAAAVVIRDREGHVMYCSPYTEILTGYPLDDVYNHSGDFFASTVPPKEREAFFRALSVPMHGEAFQYRYRFLHKNQIEMWAEMRSVPIFDAEGQVVSTLSITLDVTGAVRHQRQVEEKNRELEDFTYMVSHDLKAPIHSIKGMTLILEEDFRAQLPKEMGEIVDHIGGASRRLESLVNSVLEYSRISQQDFTLGTVPLSDVMTDVANDFTHQVTKAGGSLSFQSELPSVKGDRIRLYQIFSNLVGNALKYRSPLRPLSISIRSLPTTDSGRCVIEVEDNGRGIPADKIEFIFRPFQRAHNDDVEGTGIGLASVKKIVERLGAEIAVRSSEESGSVFTVSLQR